MTDPEPLRVRCPSGLVPTRPDLFLSASATGVTAPTTGLRRRGLAVYAAPVTRPHPLALLMLALACDPGPDESEQDLLVVPDLAICDPVADWDSLALEDALLAQINELRREGGRCGDLAFLPAPGLGMDPTLRCAARLHSQDMAARTFLAQVDPDGVGTGPRLGALGYTASTYAENVGFVQPDPDLDPDPERDARAVLLGWQDNPSTCWKLFARELRAVGIGATPGSFDPKDLEPVDGLYFTATFAAP